MTEPHKREVPTCQQRIDFNLAEWVFLMLLAWVLGLLFGLLWCFP
jgi:hypothetical protein